MSSAILKSRLKEAYASTSMELQLAKMQIGKMLRDT